MPRPAGCQFCFALPRKISLARPTVSRRSLSTCILSVPRTAEQRSVVPPTNQGALSFSVQVQECRSFSFVFAVTIHASCRLFGASWCPYNRAAQKHPKGVLFHDPYVHRL